MHEAEKGSNELYDMHKTGESDIKKRVSSGDVMD